MIIQYLVILEHIIIRNTMITIQVIGYRINPNEELIQFKFRPLEVPPSVSSVASSSVSLSLPRLERKSDENRKPRVKVVRLLSSEGGVKS